MGQITRLRVLLPQGFDTLGTVNFSIDAHGYPNCSVLWRNIWPEGSFVDDLFVQVGMLQSDDTDIFGNPRPIPARGIAQGILCDRVPALWDTSAFKATSGSWEWLRFSLDFDMYQHGPEIWRGDWHLVAQDTEGVPPFVYSWEIEE